MNQVERSFVEGTEVLRHDQFGEHFRLVEHLTQLHKTPRLAPHTTVSLLLLPNTATHEH